MEFIIVLPLYLILLGMTFFFGELSLHGVNLASSADRTAAVARGGEGWNGWNGYSASKAEEDFGKAISPSKELEDKALAYKEDGTSARPSSYTRHHAGAVADSSFSGSWAWLVAATVEDAYAMTPWTRGMVGTWAHLEKLVKMKDQPKGLGNDSVLSTLFGGGLGRVTMTGKDGVTVGGGSGAARAYSYYTLTRNSKGRVTNAYRQWPAGGLVNTVADSAIWNTLVADEPWQIAGDYASLKDDVNSGAAPPGSQEDRSTYNRYNQYKDWSD